jgi:hypothetical protein
MSGDDPVVQPEKVQTIAMLEQVSAQLMANVIKASDAWAQSVLVGAAEDA